MSDLLNKKCVPCEGGVMPFDISEIHKYQKRLIVGKSQKIKKIYFSYQKNLNSRIS